MNYIMDYNIIGEDLMRPWGGFYYISPVDLERFIREYFPNIIIDIKQSLSPKILIIDKGKRLSWQYHNRRKEIWSVLKGPVGIVRSFDDNESNTIIAQTGEIIIIEKLERHRLVGLDVQAIVAELWWHIDKNNLSDENDIIRLQDDFKR